MMMMTHLQLHSNLSQLCSSSIIHRINYRSITNFTTFFFVLESNASASDFRAFRACLKFEILFSAFSIRADSIKARTAWQPEESINHEKSIFKIEIFSLSLSFTGTGVLCSKQSARTLSRKCTFIGKKFIQKFHMPNKFRESS
jgi:hypothetical protein